MTNLQSLGFDGEELAKPVRIQMAFDAYKAANGTLSLRKAARQHGITFESLRGRVNRGAVSRQQANEDMQRLSALEEDILRDWCTQLESWGWPARICQLRKMAEEMLQAKEDNAPLGVNWQEAFLRRHPELKSRFIPPLDKERALAQDRDIIADWFELYLATKTKYGIEDEDIYNMDEKGCMMGVIGKLRVVVSRHEQKPYMTQCGNREWVSLIECVSLHGRLLPSWVIFKGKVHQKAWYTNFTDGHIALSENGWTDNELGLEWLKECFHPETEKTQKGEYRLLIFDGHASHITTEAIRFCIEKKIVLLCLPPHSTHILQPLDIGVFSPLATAYKNGVQARTRFGASYAIDKVDFLEIYSHARKEAVTEENIRSAWKKSGLSPYDPEAVMRQLPALPKVPSRPSTAERSAPLISCTPANVHQVEAIMRQVKTGTLSDPVLFVEKVCKAATRAMADLTTQRATNRDLIEASKLKEKRKNREGGNYGKARVLDAKELGIRQKFASEKAWEAIIKDFNRLSPDIFNPSARRMPRPPIKRTLAAQDRAFTQAVKQFLRLGPEIFTADADTIVVLLPAKSTTQTKAVAQRGIKGKGSRVKTHGDSGSSELAIATATTHLSSRGRLCRHKTKE